MHEIKSKDEILALIPLAQSGDKKAVDDITESMLPFVIKIAKDKCKTSNIELDDLIAAGSLGLLKAIEKFDVSRKLALTTCAAPWIKEEINNAILAANIIKIPKSKINDIDISTQSLDSEDFLNSTLLKSPDISQEEKILKKEVSEFVTQALSSLNEIQLIVITYLFGIECDAKTVDEVSKILNLSQPRIRKIQNDALNILRKNKKLSGLL